jgi:hypothetical protein
LSSVKAISPIRLPLGGYFLGVQRISKVTHVTLASTIWDYGILERSSQGLVNIHIKIKTYVIHMWFIENGEAPGQGRQQMNSC